MTFVLILFTILYVVLIALLCIGFNRVPVFKNDNVLPEIRFSIIIPFRNEADNLPHLLSSIIALNYPKHLFEVILINDDSEDNSTASITQFKKTHPEISLTLTNNKTYSNSPKKDAITLGVKQAKHEWIVTTDADCIVPTQWLTTYNAFIKKNEPIFISAPVTYDKVNTFLNRFQLLDFLSLIGTTIGCFGLKIPFLCNGANLAYKKSAFLQVNGFSNNTHIASGDDVFLLEKIKSTFPNQVHYLKSKNAVVITKPENTLTQLINQRKRWAAKALYYKGLFSKLIGFTVLGINTSLLTYFIMLILKTSSLIPFLCCLIAKIGIDLVLLYQTSSLFKQISVLRSFILSSCLYPIFNTYVVFASQISGYKWKNRAFKK